MMDDFLEVLLLLITGVYGVLLLISYFHFHRLRTDVTQSPRPLTVAVVIAARNEQQNIQALLNALELQDCPFPFDVIIVDDASDDRTTEVARSHWPKKFQLHVLQNSGAGKKDALTTGIHSTPAEIILVTDADCIPEPQWVRKMTAQFYDPACTFVGGMVRPRDGDGVLVAALITETIFLQFVSAGLFAQGNPVMCNGASMGFSRSFFAQVQGFTHDHFVSGDDVLLLQKARINTPLGIRWVKDNDAMVETPVASTFKEAMIQRHRWISKAKAYSGPLLNVMGPVFLLMQLLLPLTLVYWLSMGVFTNPFWSACILKILIELLLLSLASRFFKVSNVVLFLPVSVALYSYIAIGSAYRLFTGEVQWKGRTWKNGKV